MSSSEEEYYTERPNDHYEIKELLFRNSMKGRWEEVVKAYERNPYACVARITRSGDTALHRAVSDSQTDVALKLLEYCFRRRDNVSTYMQNDEGNTPLHLTAALGNLKICQAIVREHPDVLGVRNRLGETPVFLAARHGKGDVFSYLQTEDEREEYYRRSDGDNVLHVAIFFEFFGLAYKIIQQWPAFVDSVNERGVTPLHVLASKPDAFRSSSRLGRFHRIAYSLLVADDEDKEAKNTAELVVHVDRHNQTQDARQDDYLEIEKRGRRSTWNLFPPNYAWFVSFFKLLMKALIVIFLGFGFDWRIKKLERKREIHRWAKRVMDEMVNRSTFYEFMLRGGENPGLEDIYLYELYSEEETEVERVPVMDTPILIAARKGVCEMVEKILDEFPMAIEDSDRGGKNVVLLAIENRHPQLYIFLLNKYAKNTDILHKLDKNGNSALHMAAKCQDNWSWLIPRSLVQMHQELKWYKFVKSTMPQDFFFRENFERETPKEAFIKSHEKLIKDVNEWLNRVSESCSVVAALVASVAFATASTIPGGTMSDKGVPTLWGRPAFDVFSLASIVAFCSAVTSLVFFLSMLASRYQYAKDFPLKLFIRFSTLFISIASLVTSFLSGIVFVIDENLRHVAYALYGALCLPLVYLALKQLSLYLDLLGSIILRLPKYGQQ